MLVTKTLVVPGYQILQYLGRGANSTIWSMRDQRTGRLLALKRVVMRAPSDRRFLRQAENEFAVGHRLCHPAIRRCLQLRRDRRWLRVREIHIIMEYCPGVSVQQAPPADIAKAVAVFIQVTEALNHMHRSGFLHADMKPNNIIVAPDQTVKVIDLGQSCPIGTIKQRIQGTPDFIAPEQVHRKPLDARTDVFNFGATLYWTLTGKPIKTVIPKRSDAIQLMNQLDVAPANELNPQVPSALAGLVADCVSFQPARRPTSLQPVQTKLELVYKQICRNAQAADQPGEP